MIAFPSPVKSKLTESKIIMKPLNQKERNGLFWQFMFVFIATILIVLFAINYDFELPDKLSDVERKQYVESRAFLRNQELILREMDRINENMKLMETSSAPTAIKSDIEQSISHIRQMGDNGSDTTRNNFLVKLANVYGNYLDSKFALQELDGRYKAMTQKVNDLKVDNNQLRSENTQLQTQVRLADRMQN
jgi:hypothetical protein